MELLNLPRLRHKELQTVGENSIRICSNILEVKPAVDKVQTSLDTFKQGMQKDKSNNISKKELDGERDRYTFGLLRTIQAETYFEYQDEETAQTVLKLGAIAGRYTGITRLPLNEQTAATDNLLDEIKKLNLAEGTLTSVQRWLPFIEVSNTQFKAAHDTIIEDSARLADISAASLVAPQLTNDLHNLYTLVFAYAQIGTNPSAVEAYKELEVLINSVN